VPSIGRSPKYLQEVKREHGSEAQLNKLLPEKKKDLKHQGRYCSALGSAGMENKGYLGTW